MKTMNKRIIRGSATVAVTAAVIASVILINALIGLLTDRFDLRIDMTEEGLYRLSGKTISAVNNLERPVTVHVLMDEVNFSTEEPYTRINEVLKRYQKASNGMIELEYVDVFRNPTFADRYRGAEGINEGSLIVESDLRYKVIPIASLFVLSIDTTTTATTICGLNAEQSLTSAITFVSNSKVPSAVYIEGHNETEDSGLNYVLENMNYKRSSVNLRMEEIPEGTDLMVVFAPLVDFSGLELEKIDAFLENGGDMIVFEGIETPELPEFDAFCAEWGISFNKTIIFDPERTSASNPMQVYGVPTAHPLNKSIGDSNMLLLTPASRGIRVLWESRNGISTAPVIQTTSSAYAKKYDEKGTISSYVQEKGDEAGVQNIAVMSEKSVKNGSEYARILFIGNTYVSNENFVTSVSLLNSDFISAALNYTCEQKNQVYIQSKNYYSEQLVVVGKTQTTLFWTLVVLIPAGILACGLAEWFQRRHK